MLRNYVEKLSAIILCRAKVSELQGYWRIQKQESLISSRRGMEKCKLMFFFYNICTYFIFGLLDRFFSRDSFIVEEVNKFQINYSNLSSLLPYIAFKAKINTFEIHTYKEGFRLSYTESRVKNEHEMCNIHLYLNSYK